jgi:acyl-CoA synthetase (AMP-forming)/AMP-acid ligase II
MQQVKLAEAAQARGVDVEQIGGLAMPRDVSGEPIPPGLRSNVFGMSESLSAHSGLPFDTPLPADRAGSCGPPIGGMERRIVDPETGEAAPFGAVGELQIRGGALMSGFYKMERAQVFTPDGFYPTKDLVRLEADGHMFFVARRGDMIKTGGANVSRLEVEAALRRVPGVETPIVTGVPDPKLGERVVAAVVPAEDADLTEEGLKAEVAAVLSSYKVPKRIVFIRPDEVRLTSAGAKIKLDAMAELIAERVREDEAG